MSGKFIVFEGIDHSGKTTVINSLKEALKDTDLDKRIIYTREPGGLEANLSESIRKILLDNNSNICPEAEAYLYAASRAQHVKVIKELIAKDYIVISDRYYYSSLIYQGIGRGLGIGNIQTLNDMALQGLYPDKIFYIKIDLDTYMERKSNQKELDRIEKENIDFFEKLIEGYDQLFNKLNNVTTISTENKSREEVNNEILKYFKNYLK